MEESGRMKLVFASNLSRLALISIAKVSERGVMTSLATFSVSSSAPRIMVVSSRVSSPPFPACTSKKPNSATQDRQRVAGVWDKVPHCHENLQVFSVLLYGTELYVLYPVKSPIAAHNKIKESIFRLKSTHLDLKLQFNLIQAHASRYCPFWLVTYRHQPHGFKTYLLVRGFHILISNASFPSPIDVRSHNSPPWEPSVLAGIPARCLAMIPFVTTQLSFPLWASPQDFKTRLLWRGSSPTPTSVSHRPMTGSDTICNSPSPPLAGIVHFGLLHIVINLTILKRVC